MFRILQFFVGIFLKICYPTRIKGKKNLPKGACIISSNHSSNFDGFLLACNTWEKKYYLAKKELFQNPVTRTLLKWAGAIKIDRDNPDVGAIKTCLKLLKNGKKLVVFPSGTRNKTGDGSEVGEVKQGVSMFAIKGKVPVVPMFINRRPKLWRRTTITFGQPFELDAFYGKKLDNEVLTEASAVVAEKMEELREEVIALQNTKKVKKNKDKKVKANN